MDDEKAKIKCHLFYGAEKPLNTWSIKGINVKMIRMTVIIANKR